MLVFQLLDKYWYGGAEKVALTYHQVLSTNYDAHIIAVEGGGRSADDGVQLLPSFISVFKMLKKNTSCCQSVLIAHTTRTLIICCVLKLLNWKRMNVIHVRHFQYTVAILFVLWVLKVFISKEVLINRKEESKIKFLYGSKVSFIHNFIISNSKRTTESVAIREWANNREIVAFAGAFKEGKNPNHILRLSKYLDSSRFAFLVIGDGPEMPIFQKEMLEDSDYKNKFYLTGFCNEVENILYEASYLFFPSWNQYEMNPMVLLEAMAAGCLCIAYDMDVNKELLPPENLFSCGDFYSIAESINSQRLVSVPLKYDFNYGMRALTDLFLSLGVKPTSV